MDLFMWFVRRGISHIKMIDDSILFFKTFFILERENMCANGQTNGGHILVVDPR